MLVEGDWASLTSGRMTVDLANRGLDARNVSRNTDSRYLAQVLDRRQLRLG